MSISLSRKAARRSATAFIASIATTLSIVSGAGTAEARQTLTPNEFIGYTMKAIGYLNVAKEKIEDKDYKAALQYADYYYNRAYDPYIEPADRALSPVNGQLRKPMMEGMHHTLHFNIAACFPDADNSDGIRKCDPARDLKFIEMMKNNVARDGLILAGLVSDAEPEKTKIKAGHDLAVAVTDNLDTVTPMIDNVYNGKSSDAAVDFAKRAISGEPLTKKGHAYSDADGWLAVISHPETWSSEAKSYLSSEDDDADGDSSSSSSFMAPAAVVIGVVAALAAIATHAKGMGLAQLPKLTGLMNIK